MATNKRKDAAALFELIDKSTLKVPKGSGSLKIPSWWSSKTNPAASGSRVGVGIDDEAGGAPPPPPLAKVQGGVVQKKNEAAAPSAQQRLFDPPAADVETPETPSFRPPVPEAVKAEEAAPLPVVELPAESTVETQAAEVVETVPVVEPIVVTEPAVAPSPPPSVPKVTDLRSGKRTFAPQTMSQGQAKRLAWRPSTLRLAHAPGWMLIAGAAGAALVLILIIWAVMPKGAKAPVTTPGSNGSGPSHVERVPPPGNYTPPNNTGINPGTGHPGPTQTVDNGGKGQVYAGGSVKRSPDLFYIWIATTPDDKVAKRNAEFLADHGIDVSVEVQEVKKTKSFLYVIISVKGFPTNQAAMPFRDKIADIGKLTPEYKKTHRAWDDAFPRKVPVAN